MTDPKTNAGREPGAPFATLRRFVRPRATQERCELCSLPLGPVHRHLLEMSGRRVVCACDACALRFQSVVGGRFKLIPRDARALPDVRLTDAQWDRLALPINLAFFFKSEPDGKVRALYPSPAGVTESLLPLEAWEAMLAENPVLEEMEADVEALLVNRVGQAREYYLAPIDACYRLAGLIRMHWRGLAGGEMVWREIERFFDRLKAETGYTDQENHA